MIPYQDYPTPETQLIAHMLDYTLGQASRAMIAQNLIATATQLSAAAAYAGVLSVLCAGTQLGKYNEQVMKSLTGDLVTCTLEVCQVVTSN